MMGSLSTILGKKLGLIKNRQYRLEGRKEVISGLENPKRERIPAPERRSSMNPIVDFGPPGEEMKH